MMHGMDEPLPGAIFLARLDGSWRSRSVSAAQAFAREGSRYSHCGVYTGDGLIVHADVKAGRTVEERFDDRYGGRGVLWSDAPIRRYLSTLSGWSVPLEADVRQSVVDAARALVDAPYSYLDYLAIAANEWHWPVRDRLRGYVDGKGALICSSLIVRAFRMAGIDFLSGVRDGDVTPADLATYDEMWVRERLTDLESRVVAIESQIGDRVA